MLDQVIFCLASPLPSPLATMEEEEEGGLHPLTPGGWQPSKESLCPGQISTSEVSPHTPQTRTSSIFVKSKFFSAGSSGGRYKHCVSRFGPIISTKAILDKATNRCKGYGFVDFESPTSALAAVNELQGQGIQAQMARQAEQDPTNLYIANLPHSVKESDLESMFSAYGQVTKLSHQARTDVCVVRSSPPGF